MLCVHEYISYLYSDRFPSNFLLRNVLTQTDLDDNVVLTLSLSSTLNMSQELCCDLITELEYQHMLYVTYIIVPTICYRYPNEC